MTRVHDVASETLLEHARPFEEPFKPAGAGIRRESSRRSTRRGPTTACWCSACMAAWRKTANFRRCAKCAASHSPAPVRRPPISPSTRLPPSASPRSPACRPPTGVALEDIEAALAEHGRLIAKPSPRRIELRPDLCQCEAGPRRRPRCGEDRGLSDRAVYRRRRSDLRRAGAIGRLADRAAADRDHPGGRRVRLHRQISRQDRRRKSARDASRPRSARVMDPGAVGRIQAPVVPRLFALRLHRGRRTGRFISRPTPCRASPGPRSIPRRSRRRASNSPISFRTRSRWRPDARRDSAKWKTLVKASGAASRPASAALSFAKILRISPQTTQQAHQIASLGASDLPFVYQ